MVRNPISSGLRRPGAPGNILDTLSDKDVQYLQRVSDEVNQRFFKGHVNIEVRWGIPSACELTEPPSKLNELNPEQVARLTTACQLFHALKFEAAKEMLLPLVEIEQKESCQLYVKVLMHLKDESWPDVAKRVNRLYTDTLYVAPGSTEQREDEPPCILIHPALAPSASGRAPKYVAAYVIFHEQLHCWLQTSPEDPHPKVFRRMDGTFPGRPKAIKWLQENNFTTIEDAIL